MIDLRPNPPQAASRVRPALLHSMLLTEAVDWTLYSAQAVCTLVQLGLDPDDEHIDRLLSSVPELLPFFRWGYHGGPIWPVRLRMKILALAHELLMNLSRTLKLCDIEL